MLLSSLPDHEFLRVHFLLFVCLWLCGVYVLLLRERSPYHPLVTVSWGVKQPSTVCILAGWLNCLLTCYWTCCFPDHKLCLTLDGSVASPQTLTCKSWNFHPLHLPAHPPEYSRSAQLTHSLVHLYHPVYTLFISVYTHLVPVTATCFSWDLLTFICYLSIL